MEHKELRHLDCTIPRIADSTESSSQAFCAFSMQHHDNISEFQINITEAFYAPLMQKEKKNMHLKKVC
jgi:hypothetical protein